MNTASPSMGELVACDQNLLFPVVGIPADSTIDIFKHISTGTLITLDLTHKIEWYGRDADHGEKYKQSAFSLFQ